MELSDATEKIPATPGIDPGTFRLVAQCLNPYAVSELEGPQLCTASNDSQISRTCLYNTFTHLLTYLTTLPVRTQELPIVGRTIS
jgi:hypothetical protein